MLPSLELFLIFNRSFKYFRVATQQFSSLGRQASVLHAALVSARRPSAISGPVGLGTTRLRTWILHGQHGHWRLLVVLWGGKTASRAERAISSGVLIHRKIDFSVRQRPQSPACLPNQIQTILSMMIGLSGSKRIV